MNLEKELQDIRLRHQAADNIIKLVMYSPIVIIAALTIIEIAKKQF